MGAGRPKKDMSPEIEKQRKLSGERLTMLREGKIETPKSIEALTQSKLAYYFDRNISTVRRYESGYGIPEETAEVLEQLTGIVKEYWLGITDKITVADYKAEVEETDRRTAALDSLYKRAHSLDAAREVLFRECGFSYVHTPTPFVDFAGVINPSVEETEKTNVADGRYCLTSISDPRIEEIEFTPEEMSGLIRTLEYVIAFECFKKQSQR